MAHLKYWLWLAGRKGLAGQNMEQVLGHFGSPEAVYFSDAEEYRLIEGVSETALASLRDKSLDGADRILGDCDRLGIRIMTRQDATYPERLEAIHQPPLVLYCKGRPINFDEEVAIAIVGTRKATPYGVRAATRLAVDLTRNGALVVSGMAEGIDAAAVRGALRAGGPVVSVLGGGLDIVYPRQHRSLYADVAAVGLLLSEYPPGTIHRGTHFPIRNRIISGLSVGVVAVESSVSGGTMHTVKHASDQSRDLFVVPGPWDAPSSEGTNGLLREGAAKLIMGAGDVLCEYTQRFPGRLRQTGPAPEQRLEGVAPDAREASVQPEEDEPSEEKAVDNRSEVEYIDWKECKEKLTDDQQAVLLALGECALRPDDVVEQTQIPARRVLSALTILQIQGYVAQENGNRFRAAFRLKME